MSGHSKWSTIKHKKAIKDQKRGQLFSKIAKDITVAVQEGGSGDPIQNPRLRLVLQKARSANMPSDNIDRAIARGLGEDQDEKREEVIYEGYGPSGIAVIVRVKTDNRQRTAAELKHVYERFGGNLGGPGSAAFLFERKGGYFISKAKLAISDTSAKERILGFILQLKEMEDVEGVYSNADLPLD